MALIIVLAFNQLYIVTDKTNADNTRKFAAVPNEIQISNLGNSHGVMGFCYDDYSDKYTCFNFALISQSLSYDWRILSYYQDHLADGGVMFITVSYSSLYGANETDSEDFESKNKRYYSFLTRQYIKEYDYKQDILGKIPVLISYENLFRALGGKTANTTLERWNNCDVQDINLRENVEAAYKRHIGDNKTNSGYVINEEELEALYGIIDICKENNVTPIMVTTPYLKEYTDLISVNSPEFYSEFEEVMSEIRDKTGVAYFDYSRDERFCNDYTLFMDGDHLNRNGALRFTRILFEETRPKLEK